MLRLRNWAFAAVFYGGSVPIVLGTPVAALFGTRALRRYTHGWVAFHRWASRALLGIDFRVEGAIPAGPVLYAAKHQSLYETFQFAALLDGPAIVMKRELASIPVWGWAARRYGMIVVDREGAARALRAMMAEGEKARAEGRAVVIFPEGTLVAPRRSSPALPASTARSACRWFRSRSIPAASGRATAPSAPAPSPSASAIRSPRACRARRSSRGSTPRSTRWKADPHCQRTKTFLPEWIVNVKNKEPNGITRDATRATARNPPGHRPAPAPRSIAGSPASG